MIEPKNSTLNQDENIRWAVLVTQATAANTFLFVILGIYLAVTTGTWQAYAFSGIAVIAEVSVVLAALPLVRSGQLKNGGWVLLGTALLATVFISFLYVSIGYVAVAYNLVAGFFFIRYVLPRESRRLAIGLLVVGLVISIAAEAFNPGWRQESQLMLTISRILTTTLGLAFFAVISRQFWLQNTIRSRFLTVTLGLTLIATVVIAAISVSSLFSAGTHAQETSSQVLRSQVQDTLKHQTIETALKNDLVLQSIGQDVQDVAQQAGQILANPGAFNTESLWKADDHMFIGPDGQYINGEGDVSTVFVPNTVTITDSFKKRLELLAYLDMAFVPVYEGNPNMVAIYFVGSDETSWYYPNINLGSIVPPDYLATQDIFYTIGSPTNNPDRQVVWTPVYDDPGGQGLLVSAIAPIYARGRFMGVIGIDVSLANLTASIETEDFGAGEGSYAFLLDPEGRALALPEQGYKDILGRDREPNEFGTNLVSSAREEFSPILVDVLSGTNGFQSVTADDQEFFVAYTPVWSTPLRFWLLPPPCKLNWNKAPEYWYSNAFYRSAS